MNATPPPQNLAAEENVLGAIMLAGAAGPESSADLLAGIVTTGLRPEDFYWGSHGVVYATALELAERGEPTDVVLLRAELERSGRLAEARGPERLLELAGLAPATGNAGHFAALVVEAAERREEVKVFTLGLAATANGGLPANPKLREQLRHVLEPGRSDRPRDGGHTWRRLDLIDLGSEEPTAPDLGGLLYSRRRHVISGEDDAGKTMLLLGISAEELEAGRGVVWIDTDEMGASTILERLRGFGVEEETIRRSFAYLRPEEALSDAAREDVVALVRELDARLMVSDAFNAALTLHGYSPTQTEDVEAFWQRVVAPFCRAGAGVVLPDHVVKAKETRGRYAYGSERKATGCDLHLGLQVIEPFGRGRRGRAKITVHRDRIGFLERPSPGTFVLDSDPETGRLAWTIEPAHGLDDEGQWRPTGYMERVSRFLETRTDDPPALTQIEQNVSGGTKFKRQAIDALVHGGYAVEIAGPHGARLVKLVRPFREADEWAGSEADS